MPAAYAAGIRLSAATLSLNPMLRPPGRMEYNGRNESNCKEASARDRWR
jgi:hypothetical protein